MHSSTSSSERVAHPERLTSTERLTAADRPGVAQPVPERPVPTKAWGGILVAVAIVTLLATAIWEWRMRQVELLPGDIQDSASFWAEQRRRVNSENIAVAIVGDSRILFDTDMDRFEALTGVRPLQLALAGTNARPFLENLAADPDFKGLLLVGISEASYFRMQTGLHSDALDAYHFESPSRRVSFQIYRQLSRWLGFLDREHRLSNLLFRLDEGWRPGTRGLYLEPWKYYRTGEERQSSLWSRMETNAYLNGQARAFWARIFGAPPLGDDIIRATEKMTRDAVDAIRARGGDVIFLRPPSHGPVLANELRRTPRERVWDSLMHAAKVKGLFFLDDPVARELVPPERSHLSRACSTVYTDSFTRQLALLTPRVKLRADAPPALTPDDCKPTGAALELQRTLEKGS
jgi:hypothetical protein